MKRSTLLFIADAAAGLPVPVGNNTGAAAPAAGPAVQPLSTERLQTEIAGELLSYANVPTDNPPPAAPGSGPAAEPTAPEPPPGSEPSPGGEPAPAAPVTPSSHDDEPLPEGFEPTAVNAIARERERRRELKGRLEAEREAEKARADAEKARGDELARQLEEAKNPKGPSNDEGRTANAQSKPLDRLGSNPLIREARQEKAGHANAYQTANRLLDLLDTKPEVVIAEIKARDNVDLSDRPPEEIRYILNRAREGALLKHSESAGHLAALEREAERNLGAMAQSWTAYTHNLIPELKDPKSEAAVEHGKTFTAYPWLNEDPRGSYVAACITEGHRVLAVRAKRAQAGAAAPAGTATAAPARPVARPAVAPIPGQAASLPDAAAPAGGASALFQKFVKTGKAEDREAWMAAVMAEAARAA